MSRHQAYRNYDYENDLDEFDGEEAYGEEEEELSPEDKGMFFNVMHIVQFLPSCSMLTPPQRKWKQERSKCEMLSARKPRK